MLYNWPASFLKLDKPVIRYNNHKFKWLFEISKAGLMRTASIPIISMLTSGGNHAIIR